MTRYALATLSAVWLFAASVYAETCKTVFFPESINHGTGFFWIPTGGISWTYTYPPGATRVGLEFWSHNFDKSSPIESQYIIVFLLDAEHPDSIMFRSNNVGDLGGTEKWENHPLSTHLHPDEQLYIKWTNNAGWQQPGRLIVTIHECYP